MTKIKSSRLTKCINENCLFKKDCKKYTSKPRYLQINYLFMPIDNIKASFNCDTFSPN